MQAIWSQPVAEVVVFSNDFASRRARPSRPWATSTRQAWRMGVATGVALQNQVDRARARGQ
jgi:hypothetical protein